MSIKINDLFFTLKNTNQFKLFLKEDLGALGEKISIEKSFINYFKKINKKDLNKLVYSLLNYSGIETYLTRLGDVNLRMAAVGKQHSSYISFEISNPPITKARATKNPKVCIGNGILIPNRSLIR